MLHSRAQCAGSRRMAELSQVQADGWQRDVHMAPGATDTALRDSAGMFIKPFEICTISWAPLIGDRRVYLREGPWLAAVVPGSPAPAVPGALPLQAGVSPRGQQARKSLGNHNVQRSKLCASAEPGAHEISFCLLAFEQVRERRCRAQCCPRQKPSHVCVMLVASFVPETGPGRGPCQRPKLRRWASNNFSPSASGPHPDLHYRGLGIDNVPRILRWRLFALSASSPQQGVFVPSYHNDSVLRHVTPRLPAWLPRVCRAASYLFCAISRLSGWPCLGGTTPARSAFAS